MSKDTEALERVITNLNSMMSRAKKGADIGKIERDEKYKAMLTEYQTEDEIEDAFGWEYITEEEKDNLLHILHGSENPDRKELCVDELYILEIKGLLVMSKRRLRDLNWDETPEEDKLRITQERQDKINKSKEKKK